MPDQDFRDKVVASLARLEANGAELKGMLTTHVQSKSAHGLGERVAVETAAQKWNVHRRDLLTLALAAGMFGLAVWPLVKAHIH